MRSDYYPNVNYESLNFIDLRWGRSVDFVEWLIFFIYFTIESSVTYSPSLSATREGLSSFCFTRDSTGEGPLVHWYGSLPWIQLGSPVGPNVFVSIFGSFGYVNCLVSWSLLPPHVSFLCP